MSKIKVEYYRHLDEWWVSKVTKQHDDGYVIAYDHETLGTFKTEAEAKTFAKKQEVNNG